MQEKRQVGKPATNRYDAVISEKSRTILTRRMICLANDGQ